MKTENFKKEECVIYLPSNVNGSGIVSGKLEVILSERKDGKLFLLLDEREERKEKELKGINGIDKKDKVL